MRYIVLIVGLLLSASCGSPESNEPNEAGMIVIARKAVEAKLRDPESAQYRNEHLGSFKGVPVICGEVNAKNGFGGMSGYERFISNGGEATVLTSDMEPAEFAKVWSMTGC